MNLRAHGSPEAVVREIYRRLNRRWGPQHWWPAETPFEVIAGAILTQNTSWTNVERALAKLREAGVLSVDGVRSIDIAALEQLVRSSGYYRQKADRLKRIVRFLDEKYDGSLETMFAEPTGTLRAELLSLKGIGHETADAMLLYAGNHPVFVVDAYARRILERHELISPSAKYDEIRTLVEAALRNETVADSTIGCEARPAQLIVHAPSVMSQSHRRACTQVYNEMHGLLVQIGKHYCLKAEPKCEGCPLMGC
jgi:endonuclease III related protein